MKTYRVYYEQGIFDRHCSLWAESVEDAIDKAKRTKKEEIKVYQVDEYDKRLCEYIPVWKDMDFIF